MCILSAATPHPTESVLLEEAVAASSAHAMHLGKVVEEKTICCFHRKFSYLVGTRDLVSLVSFLATLDNIEE